MYIPKLGAPKLSSPAPPMLIISNDCYYLNTNTIIPPAPPPGPPMLIICNE